MNAPEPRRAEQRAQHLADALTHHQAIAAERDLRAAAVLAAYKTGASCIAIAGTLGVTRGSVWRWLQEVGHGHAD